MYTLQYYSKHVHDRCNIANMYNRQQYSILKWFLPIVRSRTEPTIVMKTKISQTMFLLLNAHVWTVFGACKLSQYVHFSAKEMSQLDPSGA